MSMLKVENLSVHYGMIQAVRDVSFLKSTKERLFPYRANGAGKPSSARSLKLVRPSAGKIEFLGNEIQKLPAQDCGCGAFHRFKKGHIFPGLTVLENLEMGAS